MQGEKTGRWTMAGCKAAKKRVYIERGREKKARALGPSKPTRRVWFSVNQGRNPTRRRGPGDRGLFRPLVVLNRLIAASATAPFVYCE